MAIPNELKKKFDNEASTMVRTTNDVLVCKDCLLRRDDSKIFGNTSRCEAYPKKKPNPILLGGECDKYVKE